MIEVKEGTLINPHFVTRVCKVNKGLYTFELVVDFQDGTTSYYEYSNDRARDERYRRFRAYGE